MFIKFKFMVEMQSGHKIKFIRYNGGGEYVSNEFDVLCQGHALFMSLCHHIHPNKMGLLRERIRPL